MKKRVVITGMEITSSIGTGLTKFWIAASQCAALAQPNRLATWQESLTVALQLLAGMGFGDRDRNTKLLRRHGCNVQLVVDELLLPVPRIPSINSRQSQV